MVIVCVCVVWVYCVCCVSMVYMCVCAVYEYVGYVVCVYDVYMCLHVSYTHSEVKEKLCGVRALSFNLFVGSGLEFRLAGLCSKCVNPLSHLCGSHFKMMHRTLKSLENTSFTNCHLRMKVVPTMYHNQSTKRHASSPLPGAV